MANIQDMTPVEIDTELSNLWNQEAAAEDKVRRLTAELHQAVGDNPRRVRGARGLIFDLSPEETLKLAVIKARAPRTEQEMWAAESIDKILTGWAMTTRLLEDLTARIKPYVDEYVRRGGWNRVFLATSHDGHAHNGQNCSTCHHGEYSTGFAWLIRYSGKDEDEIVADAGERACTTCYPTAPVNAKGTKMFTPDEEEAAKRRQEREEVKAKKAADADAKSITTPEGGTLSASKNNETWSICKTLRTAEIAATDALVDLIDVQRQARDPEFAWLFQNGRTVEKRTLEIARHAWCLIRSIAVKKGQTFQEVFEIHDKKAQAKVRKMDREWAKDPRNSIRIK
jgi:hypothetical protein